MKRKFEELHEPYVSSKRAKIVLPLSAIENPSTTVTFAFASEYNSAIQYSVKELFTKIRSKFAEKPRAWTNEIVVSHNTGFQVWNFKQDKLVADINHTDAKLGDIISIVQLKNGYIATGSETGNIIIWDKLYAPLRVIRAHNRNVYCLLQLADGTLVSGTAPNLLRVWNVHTGEQISEMKHEETASVMDIIQLPNGNIASACESKIFIWDYLKKECLSIMEDETNTGCVNSIIMLRNGTLVSGCASHSITLWNATVPTNCKLLKREKSLGGAVFDVIDMHNGLFATSINNSTIIFWNYEGDRIRDINVQNSMCNMYYICKNMIILEHGPNFEYWDHENGKKEISKLFPFEVEAMALLFN